MGKRMAAIVLIYLAVAIAWFVLAASVEVRTNQMEGSLKGRVAALWGDTQEQVSPQLTFVWEETVQNTEQVEEQGLKRNVTTTSLVRRERPVLLDGSDVNVDLSLAHRRKGLLWYATYLVGFRADFRYVHREPEAGELVLTYRFSHLARDLRRLPLRGRGERRCQAPARGLRAQQDGAAPDSGDPGSRRSFFNRVHLAGAGLVAVLLRTGREPGEGLLPDHEHGLPRDRLSGRDHLSRHRGAHLPGLASALALRQPHLRL